MSNALFTQTRGQGPSLVLLHGWGLNSGVWEPISQHLQQHYRITLIDLPGFGRNADRLPEQYSLQALAKWVGDHLPENTTLLGWSLGGLVAQQIAINQHPSLARLILVASSPKFSEHQAWPGIKANVLSVFEKQLERDFSKTLDRFLAIQALGSETARKDIKLIRDHVQAHPIPSEQALQAGLKMLSEEDLRPHLDKIRVPTHRLFGRLDSLVPHKAAPLIEALHSADSQHVFAKASHAPFISHPEDFLEVLHQVMAGP